MEERFVIVPKSQSGHCCFVSSIVDTKSNDSMIEFMDECTDEMIEDVLRLLNEKYSKN